MKIKKQNCSIQPLAFIAFVAIIAFGGVFKKTGTTAGGNTGNKEASHSTSIKN